MKRNEHGFLATISNVESFSRGGGSYLFPMLPFVALLMLLSSAVLAQEMVLGYAKAIDGGALYSETAEFVSVDDGGNVYLWSSFSGTEDFDPGVGVFNLTSAGMNDAFLCKLDAAGEFQWAVALGGAGEDLGIGIDVSSTAYVASNGYLTLTGSFDGTVDFDPGPGVANLTSVSPSDTFICRLDPSGVFQWAGAVIGASEVTAETDGSGGIYLTGDFVGTVDFDMGPGVSSLTGVSGNNVFVSRYDTTGAFLWARAMNVYAVDGISVGPSGNVSITGSFAGTNDFDPGPGVYNLTASPGGDIYVLNLDSAGTFRWAAAFSPPGSGFRMGGDTATDSADNVFVSGMFTGTTDFDPGPGVYTLTGTGYGDLFTVKLDGDGGFLWAAGTSCADLTHNLIPFGTAVDADGNVHTTGWFAGDNVDFDPGPGTFPITGAGNRSGFIWSLTAAGNLKWAGTMPPVDIINVLSHGMAADRVGNVYVSGLFQGATDFDPGPGDFTLTPAGATATYLMKLEPQLAPVVGVDVGETDGDQALASLLVPVATSVLANDSDPNTRETLTVTAHDATSALGATVVVNGDGTFLYDPTGVAALQALASGSSLMDSFSYTVSDGVTSVVGTVTITVLGTIPGLPVTPVWVGVFLVLCIALLGGRQCARSLQDR